jgi:hypothetical protein
VADAAAMASGLVAAVLLAVGGGPVALTGQPPPPAASGVLADRATVARLGSTRQEPAFTSFEQAAAAAGMPTARTGWLTRHQRARKLRMAHGRELLPSGQAAGSWLLPAATLRRRIDGRRQPNGAFPSDYVQRLMLAKQAGREPRREPKPRSTDRRMPQVALR